MLLTFQSLNDLRSAILSMANLKFSSDTSRTLSSNLKNILACAPQYQEIHEKIYQEKGSPAKDTPEYTDYIEAFKEEVETTTVEVDLKKISLDDLNIDQNHPPFGVIVALDPILGDFSEQKN